MTEIATIVLQSSADLIYQAQIDGICTVDNCTVDVQDLIGIQDLFGIQDLILF